MSDGQNGLPPGIDPQALQAAFAAQQQQQQQHQQQGGPGAGGMTGMNPAMFQQLQQLQMQQQQQQLQAQQGGGMGGGMAGTGFQQGSMPPSDGNNGMMAGQQQQPQATNQSGGPGQMSLPAGLQSSQDAIQMLQRLRLNMQNLQSQWAQLSNAPESPQKAEQQQRLAGEMRKMKGLHDQLFEMLKNQAAQQQQQQPRGGQQQQQSAQHAGSPAPQQQQQSQSQSQQSNEGQDSQQHLPGQQQQGQSQQQQQQQQQQASSSQQQGGFPSENPQHQAQLAVLQAFAQQQQQRQQQESGRPTISSGSQQASGSMGPPAGPVAGQQQPGFPSNGPSVAPPSQQQQQQQQHGPPQPLPIQSIPGLASSSQFLNTINSFMNQRGTPFPGGTSFGFVAPASQATHGETKTIELNALFATVMGLGGSTRLSSAAPPAQAPNQYTVSKGLMGWIILANRLGLAVAGADPNGEGNRDEIPTPAQTAERLKNWYSERLGPFEEWWTSKVKAQQQAQQQRQQQQQQQQSQQPQQPQQQPSQGPEGPQQLGQPGSSGSTPAPGASQPPSGVPMQQGLQQLAAQLSRLVNDGQMSAQEARDRFAQAQQRAAAEFAASSNDPSGQQQPGMMGNNAQSGYPTPDRRASQMQQPGVGAPQVAPSPAVAASPAPDAEGPKAKKRARKPTITKGNGKAPKTEKDGTPGAQDRHIRQTSSQASQPPPNSLGDGGQQPGSLSPRTALRMLQHGNLNPAQHAAALAVVRANSVSAGPMPSQQQQQPPPYDQRSQQQQQGYGEGPAAYAVPPMSQGPAPTPVKEEEPDHPPNKFKIEYIPTQREIHTYGGWNLGMIDEGVGHIARGFARQARTVDELGVVDIGALILSIRSRLEIEVSYALNTLLILSSGSGTATDRYGITLAHCGELLDELVELLQESAFLPADEADVATSHADAASFTVNGKATHCDWIVDVLSEETEARPKRRTRATARSRSVPLEAKTIQMGEPEALSEGAARTATPEPVARVSVDDDEQPSLRISDSKQERQAAIALVVLDVLRNFASMPANVPMLASHKDLLLLLSRLVARDEALAAMADEDEQSQLGPIVFSKTELLRVRKDVLFMLSCLASPYLELKYLPRSTVLSFFDLMSSFIVDSSKIQDLAGFTYMDQPIPPGVPPHLAPRLPPIPWSHRVPHYADLALDALSRFAQPDDNRRVISKLIPEETLLQLIQHLSRMLPYSELDFTLFRTEARLGYTERIAMCLYNLIFLSSSKTKLKLRNSSAGWASSIFRVVKRTAKQGIQQQHQGHQHGQGQGGRGGSLEFGSNPFSCLIYRLIETLTIVDESRDLLDEKVLLSFSMEDQPGGASSPSAIYRHQQRGLRQNVNAAEEERGSAAANGNSKRRAPLLAAEEWDVLGLLSMPGFDPTLASQLTSMLAG